jgi:hypothetical protein
MIVVRLQTSVAVIVRVTVVQDITREESITLDHRSLFTTSHGIMHVPWLTRMAMKRLMSIVEGITWVMMGGISNVIEDLITRLVGIVKRTTLVKVVVRVRDDLLMTLLLVVRRVILTKMMLYRKLVMSLV